MAAWQHRLCMVMHYVQLSGWQQAIISAACQGGLLWPAANTVEHLKAVRLLRGALFYAS